MRLLCVDTAGSACTVAVVADGAVAAVETAEMVRGHAEALAPMTARVLAQAAVELGACDRFAVTTGPGSFTGIRVGLAFVRALSLSSGRPAVGVDRFRAYGLDAVRRAAATPASVVVALDSRRETVFVQHMGPDGIEALSEARETSRDDLRERIAALSGAVAAGDAIEDCPPLDPTCLAVLGERVADPLPPRPYYLRAPDAVANVS